MATTLGKGALQRIILAMVADLPKQAKPRTGITFADIRARAYVPPASTGLRFSKKDAKTAGPSISRAIRALEKRRLVRCERISGLCKRTHRIYIYATPAGLKYLQRLG
jgi:hypothetical protein